MPAAGGRVYWAAMADGVTTAIVLFVFVCVLFPRLIDNRAQYYLGFVCTLLIILVGALVPLIGSPGFTRVAALLVGVLQVVAILMLFMSAGGLTVRGLTREMAGAFEVIRRGETEKEIIIPIGEQGERKERKRAVDTVGEPPERIDLTAELGDQAGYPSKAPSAQRRDRNPEDGPIPMD